MPRKTGQEQHITKQLGTFLLQGKLTRRKCTAVRENMTSDKGRLKLHREGNENGKEVGTQLGIITRMTCV